jgi:iron complex outermembrane receptor protein
LELKQSPKWQVNGGFEYERPVSQSLKLHFGADGNYKGESSGGSRGVVEATDSYVVVNARVGVGAADDKWRLTFWSRNLFDEYYFPSAYQGGNGPWVRSVGMPRTIGASFDVNF